jgi:hypothetical protein
MFQGFKKCFFSQSVTKQSDLEKKEDSHAYMFSTEHVESTTTDGRRTQGSFTIPNMIARKRGISNESATYIDGTRFLGSFSSPISTPTKARSASFTHVNIPTSHLRQISKQVSSTDSTNPRKSNLLLGVVDETKLGMTVLQVLNHKTVGLAFYEFASKRYAGEGIDFLYAMSMFDDEDEEASCCDIMSRFIVDSAPKMLNLRYDMRHDLIVAHFDEKNFHQVKLLLEGVKYEVINDLKVSDTFRQFCLSHPTANLICANSSVFLLDVWVRTDNFSRICSAVKDPKEKNLLRFCCVVADYEELPVGKEKHSRARYICTNFIHSGARFQINTLHPFYMRALLWGGYDILADARMESLQILSLNEDLTSLCRHQYGLLAQEELHTPLDQQMSIC